MQVITHYFEKPGPKNTENTLNITGEWIESSDIDTIVVATCTGRTGVLSTEKWPDKKVIVVTHSTGFREENKQELLPDQKDEIERESNNIVGMRLTMLPKTKGSYIYLIFHERR